ncbi:MAG TPA: PAS domain S-box protein [Syntrophales bacterium]|nr:PAS domain S-box protein [Syntrophales bacterium]
MKGKKRIFEFKEKTSKNISLSARIGERDPLYKIIWDHSVAGLYIVQDGKFKSVNHNAANFAGYTAADLIGKKSDIIVHPEDKAMVRRYAREMFQGVRTSPYSFRIIGKNGEIRWVMETVIVITYEGRPAILGNSMDITERMLAAQSLQESKRRLADIINFLPDPTFAIDLDEKVIAWNRSMEEMTGVRENHILGKGDYEYALPFYGTKRPMLLNRYTRPDISMEVNYRIKKREKDLLIAEMEISIHRNKKVTLWVKASPLFDSRGQIVGAIQTLRDITKFKRTEDSLRESERRLADIIDFLPDPTYAIDLEGRLIAWNRAVEEMMGVKAKDILGKGNYEHALHFYGDRRPMLLDLVLDPGRIREEDYSLFKKEGELLIAERYIPHIKAYLWGKAGPLYDRNNRVIGAIQTLRDITEFKRTEDSLRESERRLADIIDFLPDPTYAIDLEGRIIVWNRAMEELMGVKSKDILGKGNYEHALHFDGERRPMLVDLVLNPAEIREDNYSMFRREGNLLIAERYIPHIKSHLWGVAGPLYDRNNRVIGAIQSLRDITDRKRDETVLRESEDRYRTIFETTGSAMLMVEEDMTVILANTEFENTYGYGKDELENKMRWTEFIFKDDIERLKMYHISRRKDPASTPRQYESRIVAKNKQIRDVLINAELIPGTSRSVIALLDITELKQVEKALIRREQELKSKTEELEELNAALRVLLKRREEDKRELEDNVLSNIKQLVIPYVKKLKKNGSNGKALTDLNIIESNLMGIVSPFAQKLTARHLSLTPKEIQVANLIREGKTTKEIADYMDISKSAIDTHRYHIRKKMGILNKKMNLQSYLSTLM